jgi:NAD(P)-dependent dehydrogenase (short-subunit alcohol dehydrogenase family)
VREVAAWPETRSLWHDQKNTFSLDESVPLIGADKVQRGEGVRQARTGLGVNVFPEDVAEAIAFLASDRASKSTGNVVNVDGGVTAAYPR